MLLANENTYRSLSSFESVEEMNEAIKAHRSAHVLSDTERAILDVISQYACKFPGVCYLSKNKIGAAVGRVRRTVIRVCQRLEALGIIKQYETKRDGGDRRQSTNVIVILEAEHLRNPQELEMPDLANREGSPNPERLNCSKSTPVWNNEVLAESEDINDIVGNSDNNSIVPNWHEQTTEVTPDMSRQEALVKAKSNNTYKDTPISADEVIKRGLKHAIPASIYDALAPFFGGQELYDAYGILLRAKASIDRSITLETHGQAYIDAFMNVVRLYKAGKVRKSFDGLLYSAWQSVTATIKRRISSGRHPVLFDWLS